MHRKKIIVKILLVLSLLLSSLSYAEISTTSIIIFVSFSMPGESIKSILNDAEKIKAPVIIRGLIDHSFAKTFERIFQITQNKKHSVQIDPTLFKRYHIEKVPAVVIQSSQNDFVVLYGDIKLTNLLEQMRNENNEFGLIARKALSKMRQECFSA